MVSTPSMLGAAVRHGVVPAADARAGRVRVRRLARSNEVHVIERRGAPVAYVKQPGPAAAADGDDTAAVETQILAALSPLGFTPIPMSLGGSGSVWMAPLEGVELSCIDDPALLHLAAIELGRTLAALHRVALEEVSVPVAAMPWPLLEQLPGSAQLPRSMHGAIDLPEVGPVLEALRHPSIAAALRVAAAQWQPTHLVHGDIAASNVLVRTGAGCGVRIGLVDFELGGRGCPALDLTSAATMFDALAPPGLAGVCLDAYWDAGGPAQTSAPWGCVRALMTAWQVSLTHGVAGQGEVRQLLARAAELATGVAA